MSVLLTRLPHARGGEPAGASSTFRKINRLPHARGGEPFMIHFSNDSNTVCPTHVGVNRQLGRGAGAVSESAPRTWG